MNGHVVTYAFPSESIRPAPSTPEELPFATAQSTATAFSVNGQEAFAQQYNRNNYPLMSRVVPHFNNRRQDWHEFQKRTHALMDFLKTRSRWLSHS
jgi:hypothetical protein